MKKEIAYYTILLILIAGLVFIQSNSNDGSAVNISKVIDVEHFQQLDIDLMCNIYVSIGEEQGVVIEGPEHYLNRIETTLENGVLKLTKKTPGMLNGLLDNGSKNQEINLYLRLTSADQLITPTRGTLISNESSLYFDVRQEGLISLSRQLFELIRLAGAHTGSVMRWAW